MTDFKITEHAYDKAKERFGWSKATLDRMVERIYWNGIWNQNLHGKLKEFVEDKRERYPTVKNARIYGQDIFLFQGTTLVTCYRVPNPLVKYIKHQKIKK